MWTCPADGKNVTKNSHLGVRSPSGVPCASMVMLSVSSDPAKHACALPPRMPSQTSLVALRGFPSRISLKVNPLPIPCRTRSASRKFDFPLAFVPMNRFSRPNDRST